MTVRRPFILLLATAALVGAVAGTVASPAAAQAPCWKRLINDWYDGRIDNSYPVSCYREAIRNLPDDVDAYTEAREDITRALLAAIRNSPGGALDPSDLVPPASGGPGAGRNGGGSGDSDGDGTPDSEDEDTIAAPGNDEGGGGVLDAFSPSNADEVPVPLLVLAGLALLLLAAAAAGFVTRRLQARKLRPATFPNRPRSPDS
jgi:hypothetical protein